MFKSLKSLFIIEEEEPSVNPGKEEEIPSPPSENVVVGVASDEFLKIFLQAFEKNNPDGFDYLEFKRSLRSLDKMDMDEPTKYKSAYAMAQAMGASAGKIRDSASHYLGILDAEKEKFRLALENQEKTKVESRQKEQEDLNASIREKEKTVAILMKEIEEARNKVQSIEQELTDIMDKIRETEVNFNASYGLMSKQIKSDVKNIQTYLVDGQ